MRMNEAGIAGVVREHAFYSYLSEEWLRSGVMSPRVDIPLLRKGVEWVESESLRPVRERRWVQGWWRLAIKNKEGETCGTAYCLAGFITELDSAFQWVSNAESPLGTMQDMPWLRRLDSEGHVRGTLYTTRERAQELLGVTRWEAEALFMESNTAEMIRGLAETICRSRGEELGL